MRIKADLTLLLVAIVWGSAFAAQRVAGALGSLHFFNAARFLVAGLLLVPFAARSAIPRSQLAWSCVAGMILFAASALQQAGMLTTTAGNAGFLTSLYVVIVPFVLWLGWREKPGVFAMVAVALASLGAYLLSTGGNFHTHTGDLLELGGAVLWAAHVVILGKYASRFDAISFSAGQLLVASALSWLAAGAFENPTFPMPDILVVSILYTAVFSLGLGYTLQVWAQRQTPPTDAAIILSLEAVFAALAGAILLREVLTPTQILGCATIVLAVLLAQGSTWGRMGESRRRPSLVTNSNGRAHGRAAKK